MTTVLLHGVPEDLHIWDELRTHLPDREVVALGLPGFGGPLPAGFDTTKEGYFNWLVGELEKLGPVDLVGHDWGGILTTRIACARPDLVDRFVTDAVGFMNPQFQWHDLAKIWASPEKGPAYMAAQAQLTEQQRAAPLVQLGVAPAYAAHLAKPNPTRDQCILDLYRSSTQIQLDWSEIRPTKLGLFVLGDKDPFAPVARAVPYSEHLGLKVAIISDAGHFWPSHAPEAGAAAIRAFLT